MLNLPQVFSCDINQTAELWRPCWSTAFIRVPKGPLSLDLGTFCGRNRDIRSARKAPGLRHSEATPGLSLNVPWDFEAPWPSLGLCDSLRIPMNPAATKSLGGAAALRSAWKFPRTQPYGACLDCFVKCFQLSLWQVSVPGGWE